MTVDWTLLQWAVYLIGGSTVAFAVGLMAGVIRQIIIDWKEDPYDN